MSLGRNPISVLPVSMDTEAPKLLSLGDYVEATYPNDFQADDGNYDTDAFKIRTTAGTCLEYYNGRLYMAIGNFVYCTKAHDIENYDIRYNVVAGYPSDVRMIARVNDGLFISTDTDTYFLSGVGPYETNVSGSGFTQTHIMKYGAIYGTMSRFQSDIVAGSKATDTTVLWASTIGVVCGSDGGSYKLLSLNQITMPTGIQGTSTVRELDGTYQYVVCFNVGSDLFINKSDAVEIAEDQVLDTWVVNLTTSMHSRYTNYLFNSFFKYNEEYYGSNATGLYKFVGDDDFDGVTNLTSKIDAFVLTPITDFDRQEKKQLSDAIVNARSDGDLCVDITINEERDCIDNIISYQDINGIYRKRVKLPRGLQGTNWQFKISNVDGSYFKLFDFEVIANTLQRII